eukprot:scaffold53994_cov20-Tisochrysis_lutea.AAC.1
MQDPKDAMLREYQDEIKRLRALLAVGVMFNRDSVCCMSCENMSFRMRCTWKLAIGSSRISRAKGAPGSFNTAHTQMHARAQSNIHTAALLSAEGMRAAGNAGLFKGERGAGSKWRLHALLTLLSRLCSSHCQCRQKGSSHWMVRGAGSNWRLQRQKAGQR